MIDRIRLSAVAKNQLSNLKRKTGLQHYNAMCRHALCISLANPSIPPDEIQNFNGGLEIDWRIFTGGHEVLYWNLLIRRAINDGVPSEVDSLRLLLSRHVHRGLAYLSTKGEESPFSSLV